MVKIEELSITKNLNAPMDLVWKTWTLEEHLKQWWGSTTLPITVLSFNLIPNGIFQYSITTTQKKQLYGKFTFQEIKPPTKLVFRNSFTDKKGTIIPNPMTPLWPLEIENILTLEPFNDKTKITLIGRPFNASEEEINTFNESHMTLLQGFNSTFDRLDDYLKSLQTGKLQSLPIPTVEPSSNKELIIIREFNAPKELVYRMFTEAKLLQSWWGPHMFTNPVCEMDARVGGKILVHMQGPDGIANPMGGMFYELIEYEKIVFTTNTFLNKDQDPEMENLNTINLTETKPGRTRVTLKVQIIRALSERALMALTGMTEGWLQSLEKLETQMSKLN